MQKASNIYIAKCKEYENQNNDKSKSQKKSMSALNLHPTADGEGSTKAKIAMERAEIDLKKAIEHINNLYDTLDQSFILLANDVQSVEHERSNHIKNAMSWMMTCQVDLFAQTASSEFKKMPLMLENVDSTRDMNEFVEKE
jgi:hypothetical protein